VDYNYYEFPIQRFLKHHNQWKKAINKYSIEDLEAVIDGLICHPRLHQHIESPIDEHIIRIGGKIDNPFLFLFHLRYQFCPSIEKRLAERARLLVLFNQHIRDNEPIPISTLMS